MTAIDLATQTQQSNRLLDADTTPSLPAHLFAEDVSMPELEWCTQCIDGTVVLDLDAGTPQPIIDRRIEVDVQTIHGTGPNYAVLTLACGHEIATQVSRI